MVTSPTAIAEDDIEALFRREFGRDIGSTLTAGGQRDRFQSIRARRPEASIQEIEQFEAGVLSDPNVIRQEQKFLSGGFKVPATKPAPTRVDPRVIAARRTEQLRAFRKGAGRGVSRGGGQLSLLGGSDAGFSQPSLLGL
jgi:hypothetical protein